MGFVSGMLAGYCKNGKSPEHLLLAAGIPPDKLWDAQERVLLEQYAHLYELTIQALDDEGFGMFTNPLRGGSFEFLCRALVSSQTLHEAMQRVARFFRVLLPELSLSITQQNDQACLHIRQVGPLAEGIGEAGRVFAYEWLLRHLHGLFCWLVERGLSLNQIHFPYPAPAHAEDYALLYTGDSCFNAPELKACFRANLLELPIRRDESALQLFLQGAPAKLTSLYRRDRETVLRVRNLLRASMPSMLSLEEVASRLHLSPRTLHRRLEDEGSRFGSIKNALRRDMALAWIAKTPKTVAEIAAELGYADTSAFYRAFVGWTGMAPIHYQQRLMEREGRSRGIKKAELP